MRAAPQITRGCIRLVCEESGAGVVRTGLAASSRIRFGVTAGGGAAGRDSEGRCPMLSRKPIRSRWLDATGNVRATTDRQQGNAPGVNANRSSDAKQT